MLPGLLHLLLVLVDLGELHLGLRRRSLPRSVRALRPAAKPDINSVALFEAQSAARRMGNKSFANTPPAVDNGS